MRRLGKTRFFWKLYLTYSLVFLCIIALTGLLIFTKVKHTLWREFEATLDDKLSLLHPYAEAALVEGETAKLMTRTLALARFSRTRITLLAADGRVLADSAFPLGAQLENHGLRPEISAARVAGRGQELRPSSVLGAPMLYLAEAVEAKGQLLGFLRVAAPVAELDARLSDLQALMAGVSLLGFTLMLLSGLILARRVTRPLGHMMQACKAIAAGNYSYPISRQPRDEMGLLAETINKLGEEISAKIATISLERAQLKSMLAAMVEGLIAVDSQNRVLFCNQAAYRLLGCTLRDCRSMELGSLAGFARLIPIAEQARASGYLAEGELACPSDNRDRLLECHASPFAARHSAGVIIVVHDVTQIRQLERMRADFVANVSHEIKTPLTSIKGYVETLQSGALYDEKNNHRFLAKVASNTNRLIALVHDILSLAKIESHATHLHWERVSWASVIEQVLAQYDDHLRRKDLEIAKTFYKPVYIHGDREAMTQILDNLVTNAIRYSQPRSAIRIELGHAEGLGVLRVQDTGIGIPREDRERIFERFYRVDKDRSRELGGTGLGLSIVKHLVSSLHGRVEVESEVGAGSVFSVYLPMA